MAVTIMHIPMVKNKYWVAQVSHCVPLTNHTMINATVPSNVNSKMREPIMCNQTAQRFSPQSNRRKTSLEKPVQSSRVITDVAIQRSRLRGVTSIC